VPLEIRDDGMVSLLMSTGTKASASGTGMDIRDQGDGKWLVMEIMCSSILHSSLLGSPFHFPASLLSDRSIDPPTHLSYRISS